MSRILSAKRVSAQMTVLEIHAPEIASDAEGAQIVMIRSDRGEAWVPRAITDVDPEKGTFTLLWSHSCGAPLPAPPNPAANTQGTNRAVDTREPAAESSPAEVPDNEPAGPPVADATDIELAGPSGRQQPPGKESKLLFVAEGSGIGAVLPRARVFRENGCYTMIIAGYPSKNDLFWIERLDEASDELYVVTEDGSYGIKGPIRQTVRGVCEQIGDIDRVHAAGPLKLLKSTAEVTQNLGLPATVSLAAVFDDAVIVPEPGRPALLVLAPGAVDWEHSIELDAHQMDFDALARRLGIPLAK